MECKLVKCYEDAKGRLYRTLEDCERSNRCIQVSEHYEEVRKGLFKELSRYVDPREQSRGSAEATKNMEMLLDVITSGWELHSPTKQIYKAYEEEGD